VTGVQTCALPIFPPGRYTIKGTANGKTVTKTVQLTGQAERKLTLRFND
jgi:hypothetical protein